MNKIKRYFDLQICRFAAVARIISMYLVVKEQLIQCNWLVKFRKVTIIEHIFYNRLNGKSSLLAKPEMMSQQMVSTPVTALTLCH